MKKKILVFIAASLAAVMCIVGLAGCKAKSKTFERAGMQITLTDEFNERDYIGQTVCYQSDKVLVFVLKEDFSTIDSSYTLSEYAQSVLNANNMQFRVTQDREGQDYKYFTYEKSVSGNSYYYMATMHKGTDAFWLIQFACFASEKDKYNDKFLGWADSITFVSSSDSTVTA